MSQSTKEMEILKTNTYFLHIMGNNSFTLPFIDEEVDAKKG